MTCNQINGKECGSTDSRTSFLGYFTLIILIITVCYGGQLVFNRLKQSQESAFNQRADNIVRTLSELGGRYIVAFDWPLIEDLVQRAKSDSEVKAIQIEDSLSQRTFGELFSDLHENTRSFERSIIQDGRHVGRVNVVIDETLLDQTLNWLRGFVWFSVAAIVVVISGLVLMLIRARTHAQEIRQEVEERRKAEESLLKLSMAVEQSPASVVITDKNAVIEYVNPKFLEVTGYAAEEVIGGNPRILKSGLTPKETIKGLWETLIAGREWRGEFHNRKKNGQTYWEYASVSPIRAIDGSISHYIAVKEDISLRKDYERKLVRQANYDSLTGLANRLLARDRLDQAIKRTRRDQSIVGLLFIDLDHFKKVNDTLGHAAGDELLKESARRLQNCLRELDTVARSSEQDDMGTVARLGGDEFTIILPGLRRPQDAEIVADRILKACAKPFLIKDQELFLSASIGITICPDDADDTEILMRNADAAMYQAKEAGRGTFRYFKEEFNDIAQERLLMENELRYGFSHGELEVFFQPLFDSVTNTLEGAEALLRWRNPSRGLVTPNQFIPLAEDTGLIVPIGEWVLRTACEQAAIWLRHSAKPIYVSVNVATRQFQQSDLVEIVSRTLRETALPPECLKLEITETVLLEQTEKTRSIIQAIDDMGVRFSIDDFGTGYSSLSYLRTYPFESLKIDHSFVSNVTSSQNDASLVESIIAMALNLNLKVVAEGIETDDQYTFVKNAGCDTAQGFWLGLPVPATEFFKLLTPRAAEMYETAG